MACDMDLGRRIEDVFDETVWVLVFPFVYASKESLSGVGCSAQAGGAHMLEAFRLETSCWNDYDGHGSCMIA